MVLKINQAIGLHDNYENVEEEVEAEAEEAEAEEAEDQIHEKMCGIYDDFSDDVKRWIDNFCFIVQVATKEQHFIMLNILRILNLGPQPDEDIVIARNINADAINNINNRQV